MAAAIEVAVLGPVRAWARGRPLRLGTARQRTVFAVLVAAADRTVTVAELSTAVWGDSPPATARDNIYTYVSGLRRVVGDVLESGPAGYRLHLDEGARDVDRFVAMVAAAGEGARAAVRLGDALRLWRGEAYAGLEGDLFEVERAHLGRLRLDALERRARILIELGDDGVVAELSGLVRDEPLHEPLHELLIEALHRAGRPSEALAAFRAARAVLADELGVEPGARLRELHRRVLDGTRAPEPAGAGHLIGLAALLGPEFRPDALIALSGQPPFAVLAALDEAVAAGILEDTGQGLAFHDAGRAASLRDGVPASARRRAAEVLASLGYPAAEVAAQLTAGPLPADEWIRSWVIAHVDELLDQAPQSLAEVSRLLLDGPGPADRETLLVAYVKAVFRVGGRPVDAARQALELVTDAGHRAEMREILATLEARDGAPAAARTRLAAALDDGRTPPIWRTRHRVLLARLGGRSDATATLQARWRTQTIGRDHDAALRSADRGLELLGRRTQDADAYLDLLDNRIFSLQNLDRLDDADQSLHDAAVVGARDRRAEPLAVTAAVQDFWTGRWDDAVARIARLTGDSPGVGLFGRREQRAGELLRHGVAALIAVQRGEDDRAAAHLRADARTESERENGDFLLVARALRAERRRRPQDSVDLLAPLLDPGYAPMLLRHQWLPDLVRCARAAGRTEIARRAGELCAAEAAQEHTPARAAAATGRCQALLTGDPAPALAAAEHYDRVHRVVERAAALEDAAVLLAARGHAADAGRRAHEATEIYRGLTAYGNLGRLRARLAAV